ncbi:MAG TPA: hypothetical protein VF771_19135 [Longimicrobiaceae bacterium]
MILCRKCAHTAVPSMLRCPRCGFALPYWRPRRRKARTSSVGTVAGKDCPRCGVYTTRQRSPGWLRPLRVLTFHRCSYRTCQACGWHGVAFHARTPSRGREQTA